MDRADFETGGVEGRPIVGTEDGGGKGGCRNVDAPGGGADMGRAADQPEGIGINGRFRGAGIDDDGAAGCRTVGAEEGGGGGRLREDLGWAVGVRGRTSGSARDDAGPPSDEGATFSGGSFGRLEPRSGVIAGRVLFCEPRAASAVRRMTAITSRVLSQGYYIHPLATWMYLHSRSRNTWPYLLCSRLARSSPNCAKNGQTTRRLGRRWARDHSCFWSKARARAATEFIPRRRAMSSALAESDAILESSTGIPRRARVSARW